MNIAIFGSCVSRDTAEVMSDVHVVEYVARQSVVSLIARHGSSMRELERLQSPFQQKMVTGDLMGNGAARLILAREEADVVLIDLVDERRGFWLFPDNTVMTNSIEVESCGAARSARRQGARLVRFGSDEHFEWWKLGFAALEAELRSQSLWDRSILLKIEWAAAFEGAKHPHSTLLSSVGRAQRILRRGAKQAGRSFARGDGLGKLLKNVANVSPTEAEEFARRASEANRTYKRYYAHASRMTSFTISRQSESVRISRDHKWGPQPFHYRNQDYQEIAAEIRQVFKEFGE
ncbi:DUF6270 domain-containing protein [Brevibacterium sp. H602]|uniref:DUF6270 domain-containing protein n=1 Tax=Brevibacterium sp. H602 TaxID=3444316 RepID=UPI003EB8AEF4